jgi:hypothetical protein
MDYEFLNSYKLIGCFFLKKKKQVAGGFEEEKQKLNSDKLNYLGHACFRSVRN